MRCCLTKAAMPCCVFSLFKLTRSLRRAALTRSRASCDELTLTLCTRADAAARGAVAFIAGAADLIADGAVGVAPKEAAHASAAFFALAAIAAALGGGGEEGIAFSALFPAAATPAAPSGVAGVSGVLGERCNFDVSCIKRW